METILDRLAALRRELRRERLGAAIFLISDPHQSEYVPERWKSVRYFSGFAGSAGTLVVCDDGAALWTDSRYFLAAADVLQGTGIVLMKEKVAGTPTIADWLGAMLAPCANNAGAAAFTPRHPGSGARPAAEFTEVGIDGTVCSHAMARELAEALRRAGGLTLRTNLDLAQRVWTQRPAMPASPVVVQPTTWAGRAAADKLADLRAAMRRHGADALLVAALDDVAWTLNLRGADIACNPVFMAYLLVEAGAATLFTDTARLTTEALAALREAGVEVALYNKVYDAVAALRDSSLWLAPEAVNEQLWRRARARIVEATSPVAAMKAAKNAAEIDGFRRAMRQDGAAMVEFLATLHDEVARGGFTEMALDRKLTALRAAQPLYRGLSFDTIAAYGPHGAIVHYEATAETDAELQPRGLVLIDSGAQYQCGTTDITRTVALGPLTDEERRVYTLVLKGHIDLEMLKFPAGACGTQLDAVARKDLWAAGLNFMHGTGHGVGSFLNVHEGPHQIRQEYKPAPLTAGMTVTDEPGIYLAGRFGVRIENTLLVVPYMKTELGEFLQFESLTLCPIDLTPVVPALLTAEEKQWLNQYHATVREALAPLVGPSARAWLADATRELR